MTKDNPWYGVLSRVNFVHNGALDESLIYRGHEFNYWQIENAVIDMYRSYLREEFPDDEFLVMINFETGGDPHDENFMDWLWVSADDVYSYLDKLIANGAPISWKK